MKNMAFRISVRIVFAPGIFTSFVKLIAPGAMAARQAMHATAASNLAANSHRPRNHISPRANTAPARHRLAQKSSMSITHLGDDD